MFIDRTAAVLAGENPAQPGITGIADPPNRNSATHSCQCL